MTNSLLTWFVRLNPVHILKLKPLLLHFPKIGTPVYFQADQLTKPVYLTFVLSAKSQLSSHAAQSFLDQICSCSVDTFGLK